MLAMLNQGHFVSFYILVIQAGVYQLLASWSGCMPARLEKVLFPEQLKACMQVHTSVPQYLAAGDMAPGPPAKALQAKTGGVSAEQL